MKAVLDISKLTKAEKLQVMEALWADLSRNEDEVESPAWHGELLREREEKLRKGEDQFIPWEEAKRQLRERHG